MTKRKMTKRKWNRSGMPGTDEASPANEAEREREEALLAELNAELERLDRVVGDEPPDERWFRQFVEAQQRQLRRKLIRDLALFWLVALVVLAAYFAIAHGSPLLFVAIQIGAIGALPFVAWRLARRKAGERG